MVFTRIKLVATVTAYIAETCWHSPYGLRELFLFRQISSESSHLDEITAVKSKWIFLLWICNLLLQNKSVWFFVCLHKFNNHYGYPRAINTKHRIAKQIWCKHNEKIWTRRVVLSFKKDHLKRRKLFPYWHWSPETNFVWSTNNKKNEEVEKKFAGIHSVPLFWRYCA